jgi:hypothetical protein
MRCKRAEQTRAELSKARPGKENLLVAMVWSTCLNNPSVWSMEWKLYSSICSTTVQYNLRTCVIYVLPRGKGRENEVAFSILIPNNNNNIYTNLLYIDIRISCFKCIN